MVILDSVSSFRDDRNVLLCGLNSEIAAKTLKNVADVCDAIAVINESKI